jgi:uncharacterized membrane protein YqjE
VSDHVTDRPTEPKRADQSLGELVKEMTTELGDIFRQEVELAKVEAREELRRSTMAAAAMAAGAVAALLLLILASFALAELLDQGLNRALSFAIVAVLWAIVAAVLLSTGRNRMRQVRPLPETKRSLEEDKEWAKNLKS